MLQHNSSRNQIHFTLARAQEAGSRQVGTFLVFYDFIVSSTIPFCRNDYSIEVWNLANGPFLERSIPGKWHESVEAICWVGSRLFSIGLSGDGLKEWDLATLTPKRRLLLTGERGICMDYHKATGILAIGTEEGIINLFDTSDDDLQFSRLLDRQDHRISCCKFNDAGDKLASGSLDAVKVWNVQTGQVLHKMSTGRSEVNQETIVWCIDILDDFTIITGDSRGRVTFWDGNLGSQIDYVLASTSDIMCLSVSQDRKSFFCSGVEQILRKFTHVKTMKGGNEVEQWVKCSKRAKVHTHDVLAMITMGNDQLISGGIDGFLSFVSQDFKNVEKVGPFLKRPFAEVANESRLILMKYVNYMEVWKLASGNKLAVDRNKYAKPEKLFEDDEDDVVVPDAVASPQTENKIYRMSEFPEKLLELRTKDDEMIVSCAISSDGHWIAYSTINAIRLFRFGVQGNSKPMLKLVKQVPSQFKSCVNMVFSKDSSSLIIVKNDGQCSVFDLDAESVEHKETFSIQEHHSDLIHLVEISSCSKFLVLAGLCNTISIWNLKRNKWTHTQTLPKYACPATSLSIRSGQPILVVSFSDNKLIEFNLDENMIQFSTKLPETSNKVGSIVTNVCLDPRNQNAIIFARNNSIHVLEKSSTKESTKKAKTLTANSDCNTKTVKTFNTVSSTGDIHSIITHSSLSF